METTKPVVKRVKKVPMPITLDPQPTENKPLLKQGTTWAGIMTIGAAIATGGLGALADPAALTQIGIGLSLLFAEN